MNDRSIYLELAQEFDREYDKRGPLPAEERLDIYEFIQLGLLAGYSVRVSTESVYQQLEGFDLADRPDRRAQ